MLHSLMDQYVPWYTALTETEKPFFQQRVQQLIKGRQFKGRQDFVVTDAHKILIAAGAAWVTRGFDKFYYPHFNLITIYPNDYFGLIKKRYQNQRIKLPGAAVVSWHNLEVEYTTQPLPFQSLFHEFAHAVYHENVDMEEGYAAIDIAILQQFQNDYAAIVSERLPADGDFIHKAIVEQPQQFFASASEWFFTDPAGMAQSADALHNWLDFVYQVS